MTSFCQPLVLVSSTRLFLLLLTITCLSSPSAKAQAPSTDSLFPDELTSFVPYPHNPVFVAAGIDTWETRIRERGFILKDEFGYHLWYTGYDGTPTGRRMLGYASSNDGINWKRFAGNPIHRDEWVEDVFVLRDGATYHMFAEGVNDRAQHLTSTDRIHWTRQGLLDVRLTNGQPIPPGPYGTPCVLRENGVWHLFYERQDKGIWLARSSDMKVWTNVNDQPILYPGPAAHEQQMIAMNQVIRHGDRYYALYHGRGASPVWCSCLATSTDMIHWAKYTRNPLLADNQSSPQFLKVDGSYRLYACHDKITLFLPKNP